MNYVSVTCRQCAVYDGDVSVVNTVLWQGVKKMSQRGSTQSHWAQLCVEIMYVISYPLPMTHMIISYSGLALSLYIILVQGHGVAPITVKDKQNIFYCVFVWGERLWNISVS